MPLDKIVTRASVDVLDASAVGLRVDAPSDWMDEPHDPAAALDELRTLRREHHVVFFSSAEGVTFDETGII